MVTRIHYPMFPMVIFDGPEVQLPCSDTTTLALHFIPQQAPMMGYWTCSLATGVKLFRTNPLAHQMCKSGVTSSVGSRPRVNRALIDVLCGIIKIPRPLVPSPSVRSNIESRPANPPNGELIRCKILDKSL